MRPFEPRQSWGMSAKRALLMPSAWCASLFFHCEVNRDWVYEICTTGKFLRMFVRPDDACQWWNWAPRRTKNPKLAAADLIFGCMKIIVVYLVIALLTWSYLSPG
ncbi:MAG: hypothetical protein HY686_01580 [Chloroflexi bacterium]|nr:hypothetical protein [Chloroflexota bacterium]